MGIRETPGINLQTKYYVYIVVLLFGHASKTALLKWVICGHNESVNVLYKVFSLQHLKLYWQAIQDYHSKDFRKTAKTLLYYFCYHY